jgi:tetratricopeptide (TPR) repeat protein
VDEALQSQACRLADGNPRLLEWLDKVLLNLDPPQPPFLRGEQNTVAEILACLEADPVELREQVLAEALLAQIDQTLEEMLRRGLVFELPVPREAIVAVCEGIPNLQQQINRAVALGLLEVSPDSWLRVPRILPLKLPENAEVLYKQAVDVLYRLWWRDAVHQPTDEQVLEIHHLALQGKAEEISIGVAKYLTDEWIYRSRYRESVKVCQDTLEIFKDCRIFHNLARCERNLGDVSNAIWYFQQALNLCPPEDEKEKAAIIHNLAILNINQGEPEVAIALYQQSLGLTEGISNVGSKGVTLHQMGILKLNQGKIEEAITLFEQSFAITESIDYVKTRAATVLQLAQIKANQGKIADALTLFEQSLVLTDRIDDIQGKAATLHYLAMLKTNQGQFETAISLCQQSLSLTEGIGDVYGQATTLHQLAVLNTRLGHIEKAIKLFEQSLEISERINYVPGKAMTLANLGELLAYEKGDFVTALSYLQQSLKILQHLQSPDAKTVREILARVQQMRDDIS